MHENAFNDLDDKLNLPASGVHNSILAGAMNIKLVLRRCCKQNFVVIIVIRSNGRCVA